MECLFCKGQPPSVTLQAVSLSDSLFCFCQCIDLERVAALPASFPIKLEPSFVHILGFPCGIEGFI